jgi:hypothetical protein
MLRFKRALVTAASAAASAEDESFARVSGLPLITPSRPLAASASLRSTPWRASAARIPRCLRTAS